MQDQLQVPKGLTLIDQSQAPSGAEPSTGVKVPKGLTLVDGEQQPTQQPSAVESNIPNGLTLMPTEKWWHLSTEQKPAPRDQVYASTIAEGQTPDRAKQRVAEYDRAIAAGFSPDKATRFASTKTFDDQPKVKLSEQEKNSIAQAQLKRFVELNKKAHERPGSLDEEETHVWNLSDINPEKSARKYADAYAYARAEGWNEADSQKYATEAMNIIGGANFRAEKALGHTFQRVSDYVDRFAGKHGIWKPDIAKRIDRTLGLSEEVGRELELEESGGALTGGLVAKATSNSELGFRVSSWMNKGDSKSARLASSLDSHLAHFIGGMLTPTNIALMAATKGLGAFEGRAATEALEVEEANKVLPVSVQKIARTTQSLAHAGFTLQMAQGTSEATKAAGESWKKGERSEAVGYMLDALTSGVMTYGGLHEMEAHSQIKADLDATTRAMYGNPQVEGEGPTQKAATKFGDLNDYQQAAVITKMIEDSPEYKEAADTTHKNAERSAKKLAYKHSRALAEAWNPSAAARTIRTIHDQRAEGERIDTERAIADAVKKIREQYAEQQRQSVSEYFDLRRDERPGRRGNAAADRSAVGRVVTGIADRRENVWEQRNDVTEEAESGVPQREIEAIPDGQGGSAYPAFYWGEENTFGTAPGITGHSVYRQTPRGVEWLDENGNFSEEPDSLYSTPDSETADTLARLQALGAHTSTLADAEGAHPEVIKDADEIAEIRRSLVNGEIDTKEAQRRAGIAEKVKLPDEYAAARGGNLNGPFSESGPSGYFDALREEAAQAGLTDEETEAILDESGVLARQQTENNLHHVYRPGDYIVSKRGVRWTLDAKGLLHPDDGGQPVPLMKRGLYSNSARQLAGSGRVGYGTTTREQRRATAARQREALADIRDHQESVDREMRLAAQREGLTPAAEAEPRADMDEKAQREGRFMSRPPKRPESSVGQIVRMVLRAPADANSVIKAIANRSGVTPEEVMRLQLTNDPERATTVEGKAARLEAGDTITDDFRKNMPWKVEEGKDGKMHLRSGNASPLPLDRLNPSERVKGIIEKGSITGQKPEFSAEDVNRAAFDVPHYVRHEESLVEEVRDRKAGKVKDPEPRNEVQAKAQVRAAENRAQAAHAVALRAVEESISDTGNTSVEEAEKKVEAAEESIQVAKEAKAQEIEAQAKISPKGDFSQRAPISIGLRGKSGVIEQNNRQFRYHYELVPVESIVMSHVWNGDSLEANPDFFKPLQPREPKPGQVLQQRLDAQRFAVGDDGVTSGYNFAKYANQTIDAMSGPPVLEQGGQTVSGNGRLRRLAKHLQVLGEIGDAEEREAAELSMKGAMRALATSVGIPEYPNDGKSYAVVRMLDDPIETEAKASELGLFFNTSEADAISEGAKGIVYGRTLDTDTVRKIGNLAEASEGGLEAAMREDPDYFVRLVVEKFGIPDSQRSEWITQDALGSPRLTEAGERQFRRAVKGYAIKDITVLDRIENSTADRAFEKALGYLVQLAKFPELDISGKITEALQATGETLGTDAGLSVSRDKWLATYHPDQTELLGMETELPPEPDRVVETLWRALHASNAASPRVFSDRLKKLLSDETVQGGMFGGPVEEKETPAEKFNRVFAKELAEVQHSRGDRTRGLSDEEFEQALKNREVSDVEREEAQSGTSFEDVERFAVPDNIVGQGGNATVYGMNDDYVLRVPNKRGGKVKFEKAEKIPDPFPDRNYGQAVAKAGEATILRKQSGVPAGVPYGETRNSSPEAKATYRKSTERAANMPQEAYTRLAHDFQYLNDHGYQFDPSKSNNLLIDSDGKKFNVVDLNPRGGSYRNTAQEIAVVLMDNAYANYGDVTGDAEMQQWRKQIISKVRTAARETGLPIDENDPSFNFSKRLAGESSGLERPPKPPAKEEIATVNLSVAKQEDGYVTPAKLKEFLENHPATKDSAAELFRTARLMAEYVYESDPPIGVDKKDALDWVLKERLAGIEAGELKSKRGQYSDPNVEKNWGDRIMKLHKAADASTFIHEFAHVIFPMLSDEDLRAIDTIYGEKGKVWDGTKRLDSDAYKALSEKLAHGMEKFLRDENPTGFSSEVKAVLAKIKEMMKKVYMAFAKDPLSKFENTEQSREVFSKMFGITDFDVQDDWQRELKKARAEENRFKSPKETPHPLQKQATEAGATGLRDTLAGKVEDTTGDRVDPRKPTAVFVFANAESVASFWQRVATGDTKLENAELIHAEDDTYGVRFNTKAKVSPDVMYQDLPQRHIGLQLEDARKLLESTPDSFPSLRKLRQLKVQNLENEIRAKYGADELAPESAGEDAKQVLQEVKSEKGANGVRKDADAVPGVQDARRAGGISKPPVFRVPVNAGAGQRGLTPRPERVPTSLSEVTPVRLEPLPKPRGVSVGTVVGETFDAKAWVEGLKRAGLPETLPAPTWALDRKTADKLVFPGQKQVVQTALSALVQGDGAVVASATGTGKTYTSMAIAKEWMKEHPDAKILVITKNASLLKGTQGVAANTFGFEVENTVPDADAPTGVYGTTYSRIIRSEAAKNTKWDLVIADESGEARNWFREENKQGKALKDITANAQKALYFSATPFHSPMEYGYLDKLGMWPKNGFDRWIENNFAHEKVDDKIVAKLDPGKQAKLRQQLIERGQLVSQAISYDGFTAHFGVVPVTDAMKRGLDRIHEGFARAKKQLVDMKKKGVAEKAAALEATYTKAFLERERLPIAIEIAKKARANGWMVAIFSETSSEDLFRRPTDDPGTYQQLDTLMGGQLSQIIPPFENVYDRLREEFGSEIGDYSGMGNTNAERERAKGDFLAGETPMLYSTFAAGGIGVSLHDADFPERGIKGGDKPRIAIYLGPPYSGVLLEQAMGRFWRFGVKSDTHAVFLATDSEPDVRLMQQKVGPRMRALRASVLGERDSLASAMASYTDDEKVRARQDALAYQEGNEQRVDAASFQVRSKSRNVGINDWSQINFPPADTAKNKGMKYGEDVAGGDWSTLYQNSEKAWMQQPESPNEAAGNYTVDAIGNGLAAGDGLPEGVSVQNLEPADRDVVIGASSAVAADAVEHPVERDRAATARQSMQSSLNLPGDKDKWILTFPKGKKGVWQYTGDPTDIGRAEGPENEPKPKDIRAWYGGAMFTQEVGIRSIAKQAGNREAGENIVRMNRSYQADADTHFASFALEAQNLMRENKLDEDDPKLMSELWDAVEGKRVSDNPAIIRAASQIADLHERVHGAEAAADVKLKTPAGETISWKEFGKDRNYMPHRIDWEAQVQDPQTGEVHTLKDVMKETFAESSRRRIIETIAKERGYSYDRVIEYLKAYAPNTPVLGHIHRARTIDFPFIKKDWKTLMGYYRQAADAIAVEKNFGSDRKKLDAEIDRIKSVNGRKTISSMFDGLLEPQEWQDWTAKAYNAAIAYEAVTKMTISILKLPTHLIHVPMGLKGRVRPLAKAILHTALHPRETFENASYVGTLARQLNAADVIAKDDSQGITHQIFGKTGFNAAYKMVRAVSGESARIWMEQYAMHELKKGNAAEARRLLKDVMLIGDQGIDQALANGRFSPEDLGRGQTAFANMVAWTNNPLQMPGWARLHIERGESTTTVGLKRAVRLTYALQSFSLKSMSLLREHMWDEVMIHKNYKPLAYFMIAAPVAGQLLQATTAAGKGFIHRSFEGILGRKHSEDSWDKYIAELEGTMRDPKPAKMLKFYLDSVTLGYGMDMLRTVADPLLNLATGELKKAGQQFEYAGQDILSHFAGPAFDDLWKTLVELPSTIGHIEAGTSNPAQKPKKVKAAAEKYVVGQVPILRQVPGMVPPPKKPTRR